MLITDKGMKSHYDSRPTWRQQKPGHKTQVRAQQSIEASSVADLWFRASRDLQTRHVCVTRLVAL